MKSAIRACFYIILFVSAKSLWAQNQSQAALQNASNRLSGLIVGTVFSNPQEIDNADNVNGGELTGTLRVRTDDGALIGFSVGIDKQLDGERRENLRDSNLSYFKNIGRFKGVNTFFRTSLTLPFSENSKDRQSLITSIRPSIRFDYSPFKNFFVTFLPSLRVNFHEFEVAINGVSNTQYQVATGGELSYSLTNTLLVALGGSYARGFTYQSNTRDTYQLSQSLTYFINAKTIASLGHSLGGTPLAPNGTDTEIRIYDSRASIYFLSLILVL